MYLVYIIERGWAKNLVPLHDYVPDSPAITVEAEVADTECRPTGRHSVSAKKEIGIVGLGKMGAGSSRK
jgi:hypothetical protein